MAKPYIKLDLDWREDAKVILFESRYKKAALVDLVQLFVLMGEFGGSIDMTDEGARLRVQKVLGKSAAETRRFIARCADCGIVSNDAWEAFQRVGSERSEKDGTARKKRRDYALAASAAAAEKRDGAMP